MKVIALIRVAKQSDGGASVLPSIHAKYADYLYGSVCFPILFFVF